ncbi:MAG: DUF624 domain-containing protein [Clostridia bacterium]|nr:DUF624 domain-containing protein [Clostridia bacterium]
MSGLMNSYFYGKAGKGDYTVEQMPTTRKQLFFTTLRVRLSSMVGLNFLHVLFLIPLLIWTFLSSQTLILYSSDEAYMFGGEAMENAYHEYQDLKTQYEATVNAPEQIVLLQSKLDDVVDNIKNINEGKVIMVEEAPIVEGGEATQRPLTVEELTVQKEELEAQIAVNEELSKATEKDIELLGTEYVKAYNYYNEFVSSNLKSQLSLILLVMIPLIALAGIGSTGQMYVLRNWARDEHSFMWSDYKATIKSNWKQGLVIGLLNGLSIYIFYIAYITYGDMAAKSGWFFVIPQMLMVMLLVIWWMMNEIIFPMMVTYDMKIRQLIRNSAIMVIARLPYSILILIGSLVPAVIGLCLPIQFSMIFIVLFYGLIGFSLTGFLYASYANSLFDRFLNPRIEGAEVNKGLREAEEDDDDEDDKQEEVVLKEDRFWERKSK